MHTKSVEICRALCARILIPSYFKDSSYASDYLTSFRTIMCARTSECTTEHQKSRTPHPLDGVGVILPGWPYHMQCACYGSGIDLGRSKIPESFWGSMPLNPHMVASAFCAEILTDVVCPYCTLASSLFWLYTHLLPSTYY